MQFTFQMHRQSLVGVSSRLQRSTDLADLEIPVLLLLGAVSKSLKLSLLLLKLFHLCHDSLSVFDLAFFSEFLCVFVVNVDFCLELVDFLVHAFLLECVHLWLALHFLSGLIASLRPVLNSYDASLDLLIDKRHHFSQLDNQLVLVLAFKALPLRVVDELILKKVVVALLTRPNVCLCVREQVIWAEGKQVELADLSERKSQ